MRLKIAISFSGAVCLAFLWAGAVTAQPRVRLAHLISAHQGRVLDVAVSPNGKQVVSAGEDGKVRFWDREGKPGLTVSLGAPIEQVHFSLDGARWACLSRGTARFYNLQGKLLDQLQLGKYQVAFSPDLRLVVRNSGSLGLFQVGRPRPSVLIPSVAEGGYSLSCLAISPDNQKIVLGGSVYNPAAPGLPDDSVAWQYDVKKRSMSKSFPTEEFGTRLVAFAPDGRRALAGNRHPDSDTAGWLTLDPPVQGVEHAYPGVVEEVNFSPNSRLLVVVEAQTSVWDLRNGTRLGTLGLGFSEAALGDDFAVTGDAQGKVQFWEWTSR